MDRVTSRTRRLGVALGLTWRWRPPSSSEAWPPTPSACCPTPATTSPTWPGWSCRCGRALHAAAPQPDPFLRLPPGDDPGRSCQRGGDRRRHRRHRGRERRPSGPPARRARSHRGRHRRRGPGGERTGRHDGARPPGPQHAGRVLAHGRAMPWGRWPSWSPGPCSSPGPSLEWIDPTASLVVAAIIVVEAYRLLRESVDVLLESAPADMDLDALSATMHGVPGVAEVHDLHVWSLSSDVRALSAHVVLTGHPSLEEAQVVGDNVKTAIGGPFTIAHSTLELECERCRDDEADPCLMDVPPRAARPRPPPGDGRRPGGRGASPRPRARPRAGRGLPGLVRPPGPADPSWAAGCATPPTAAWRRSSRAAPPPSRPWCRGAAPGHRWPGWRRVEVSDEVAASGTGIHDPLTPRHRLGASRHGVATTRRARHPGPLVRPGRGKAPSSRCDRSRPHSSGPTPSVGGSLHPGSRPCAEHCAARSQGTARHITFHLTTGLVALPVRNTSALRHSHRSLGGSLPAGWVTLCARVTPRSRGWREIPMFSRIRMLIPNSRDVVPRCGSAFPNRRWRSPQPIPKGGTARASRDGAPSSILVTWRATPVTDDTDD